MAMNRNRGRCIREVCQLVHCAPPNLFHPCRACRQCYLWLEHLDSEILRAQNDARADATLPSDPTLAVFNDEILTALRGALLTATLAHTP